MTLVDMVLANISVALAVIYSQVEATFLRLRPEAFLGGLADNGDLLGVKAHAFPVPQGPPLPDAVP